MTEADCWSAAKLRSWRVSILRTRAQHLGDVEAPDEKEAEAEGRCGDVDIAGMWRNMRANAADAALAGAHLETPGAGITISVTACGYLCGACRSILKESSCSSSSPSFWPSLQSRPT